MKLSNTWFALILIALVLLLSGAQNVSAQSPSPAPNQIPRASGGAQNSNDEEGSPQATPSFGNQESADQHQAPTATKAPDDSSEKYQEALVDSAVVQAAFAVLLFFVTGLLAYIAVQQWRAYKNLNAARSLSMKSSLGIFCRNRSWRMTKPPT